jgi:hypothetical protein
MLDQKGTGKTSLLRLSREAATLHGQSMGIDRACVTKVLQIVNASGDTTCGEENHED